MFACDDSFSTKKILTSLFIFHELFQKSRWMSMSAIFSFAYRYSQAYLWYSLIFVQLLSVKMQWCVIGGSVQLLQLYDKHPSLRYEDITKKIGSITFRASYYMRGLVYRYQNCMENGVGKIVKYFCGWKPVVFDGIIVLTISIGRLAWCNG